MSAAIQAEPGPDERSGRWAVVAAHGDLDLATGPELDRALNDAVPADDATRHLVLDLRAVTFLDCSGLRPLLRARRRLADRFWLANVPLQTRRMLELTGLTDAFAVLDAVPAVTTRTGPAVREAHVTDLDPERPRFGTRESVQDSGLALGRDVEGMPAGLPDGLQE